MYRGRRRIDQLAFSKGLNSVAKPLLVLWALIGLITLAALWWLV